MREQGFRRHTMDEIDERGLDAVLSDALQRVAARAPRVYLTVDIDVLDPAFAPRTGTPEPGERAALDVLTGIAMRRGGQRA